MTSRWIACVLRQLTVSSIAHEVSWRREPVVVDALVVVEEQPDVALPRSSSRGVAGWRTSRRGDHGPRRRSARRTAGRASLPPRSAPREGSRRRTPAAPPPGGYWGILTSARLRKAIGRARGRCGTRRRSSRSRSTEMLGEAFVEADEQHLLPASREPLGMLDRQHRLAGAGTAVIDHLRRCGAAAPARACWTVSGPAPPPRRGCPLGQRHPELDGRDEQLPQHRGSARSPAADALLARRRGGTPRTRSIDCLEGRACRSGR